MTGPGPAAAFLCDAPGSVDRVFDASVRARLSGLASFRPGVVSSADLASLREVEFLFSTWGMPALDARAWQGLPRLKALFYAAGSVQAFARPLLDQGVRLFSAWEANAAPVAEYCLAQILLAGKRFLPLSRALGQAGPTAWSADGIPGNRGQTLALLGAGKVGRALITLLKPFHWRILVFDPHLDGAEAIRLGVEKVALEEAFARALVLSNHLADLPETRGLISGDLLASLPEGATFINTGRGATVDEPGLWRVLGGRRDLTAVLDVCVGEPPPAGSPAYGLPNVFLSPHVAGSLGGEVPAMGLAMADEFEALLAGRPLRHEVTAEMLERMA